MNDDEANQDWVGWPDWAREAIKDSPEANELRGLTWAEMLPSPPTTTPQMRSYVAWMGITHHGKRSPSSPACSGCGSVMSDEQIEDYYAALGRPPGSGRWI
jgi:hypothetical protein